MIDASLLAVLKRVLYLDWRVEAGFSMNADRHMHSSSSGIENISELRNRSFWD